MISNNYTVINDSSTVVIADITDSTKTNCDGVRNCSGVTGDLQVELVSGNIHTFKNIQDCCEISARIKRIIPGGTTLTTVEKISITPDLGFDQEEIVVDPPVNVTAPVISGVTYIGKTLTSTTGTWTNTPTEYSYQWYSGETPIGTDSSTYIVEEAYNGTSITCAVTATNQAGSSDPETSNALHHFIPTDISSTTALIWHNYLYDSTITRASGKVQQIDDIIGSIDYSNAAPSEQPLDDDTDDQVLFDTEGQSLYYSGNIPGQYADVVFIVCKPTTDVDETTGNEHLWHAWSSGRVGVGNTTGALTDEVISVLDSGFTSRVAADKNSYPTLSSSTKHCIISYYTGDTIPWSIKVDGGSNIANIQAGSLGRIPLFTASKIGMGAELRSTQPAFHTFNGGITDEVICSGTGVTTSDIQKLEGYAHWQHGSPIASGHPYENSPPDAP